MKKNSKFLPLILLVLFFEVAALAGTGTYDDGYRDGFEAGAAACETNEAHACVTDFEFTDIARGIISAISFKPSLAVNKLSSEACVSVCNLSKATTRCTFACRNQIARGDFKCSKIARQSRGRW